MATDQLTFTTPITAALLRGCIEIEQTATGVVPHRLPGWAREQAGDPQLAMAEAQPSGVRLVFRTAATRIALTTLPTRRAYIGMPARPDGVYELSVDGHVVAQHSAASGNIIEIDMAKESAEFVPGAPQTLEFDDLPGRDKQIEIWLPHNETTELVSLGADAGLAPVDQGDRPVWLHHGSSISQGSNAATPTGIWPALAARQANVDLVNLGFGGSALLDPFTARTMRDMPADLISVKIGINLVNLDLMRLRAFGPAVDGFLDAIREGHPDTPLLVVSPLYCPIHETTPGPGAFDRTLLAQGRLSFVAQGNPAEVAQGKLTLSVIREQLQAIVARRASTDTNLHYLDGLTLYGAADNAALPLPDQLHPDAATHRLIGSRFGQQLEMMLREGTPRAS